jgi:pimeloyl-ACP methyl ester carboxylesterase
MLTLHCIEYNARQGGRMPQESNVTVIRANGLDRAVVFLHGFIGGRDDTWDRFPLLLGSATPDWDIFAIGYATTLLPDVVGIWSADPDLPILATLLRTQLSIPPLQTFRSLTLIAHSMGGLIVQKALVDDPSLAARVGLVILFGTPSAGLRKASWIKFWKRQLKNMAAGSSFISGLRADWGRLYGSATPFNFLTVAGASDQFVPPESSLEPFDRPFQKVVVGDHLSIVKPANSDAPSLQLVLETLKTGTAPTLTAREEVRLAAESQTSEAPRLVREMEVTAPAAGFSAKDIVDAALALDRAGKRAESIALLERYQDKDTDVKGTLGGRFKRLWFDTDQSEYADRALQLYEEALDSALKSNDSDQIYYLAINVAFMKFAYSQDQTAARKMAELAIKHADSPGKDVWKTATVAEAHLYFGRTADALAEYQRLLTLGVEEWKLRSTSLQASRIAARLGNRDLAENLEGIFTPGASRVNRIFVSYSHKDREWLDRLRAMIAPYLREAEAELDFWDDTRLEAGQQWDVEIRRALERAGVAIALVSSQFLASSYVTEYELPEMIKASDEGGLKLLWAYISAAGWEETSLKRFQATHDTKQALDRLALPEQNEILKSIARQIKEAALSATDRFKSLSAHEQSA